MANAHDFSFKDHLGKDIPLADYKGNVVLIVNTASECGLKAQYLGLQKLYDQFRKKGLEVLAVPCNDFGNQEPGSDLEVRKNILSNYPVNYTITAKERVKGDIAHPFYKWARTQTRFWGKPKWNFHKYLIDKDGNIVDWFASSTSPVSVKVVNAIRKALN